MPTPSHDRVPHLRDGFIVAKVGIERNGVPSERLCSVGWRSETAFNNSIQEEAPE
jgi:hypothetical protein